MREKERRDRKKSRKGKRGQCDIDLTGEARWRVEVFFNNSGDFSVNLKLFQNKKFFLKERERESHYQDSDLDLWLYIIFFSLPFILYVKFSDDILRNKILQLYTVMKMHLADNVPQTKLRCRLCQHITLLAGPFSP